tara:strand:- start:284 stop:688 length:405 start_codon:yes stop_codon:yes gene_type:complete
MIDSNKYMIDIDFFTVLIIMELTFKDTLMFYQTSLRNVGLYTSISLALLGVSRFYRGKDDFIYNTSFILLSMTTLFLAFSILKNLNINVSASKENLKDEKQQAIINEWLAISKILQFVLIIISLFSVYTLYRQM